MGERLVNAEEVEPVLLARLVLNGESGRLAGKTDMGAEIRLLRDLANAQGVVVASCVTGRLL